MKFSSRRKLLGITGIFAGLGATFAFLHPAHSHSYVSKMPTQLPNIPQSPGNDDPILTNPGLLQFGYLDTGLILATLGKSLNRGLFWGSTIFDLNYGDIGMGAVTHGSSVIYHFDTTPEAYSLGAHRKLESGKAYIFEYVRTLIPNPFTRSYQHKIVDVYDAAIGKRVPKKLEAGYTAPMTPLVSYERGDASGTMIKVQRWGRLWSSCTLTLHLGGTRLEERTVEKPLSYRPHGGEWQHGTQRTTVNKPVLNTLKMNLQDDAGCKSMQKHYCDMESQSLSTMLKVILSFMITEQSSIVLPSKT